MFQTFTETADATKGAERVALLRAKLKEMRLDGLIVPRADEHQGEYVPKSAARLAWLTGFTGSAGTAVVLADKAAIFVDGRYTLQVREQVDPAVFTPVAVMETSVADWLKANALRGTAHRLRPVADDPRAGEADREGPGRGRRRACAGREEPGRCNLDATGPSRRSPPSSSSRRSSPERRWRRRSRRSPRSVGDKRADVAVLTDPASIAWLFNIRGGDISHTPFPALLRGGAGKGPV